MAYNMQHTGSQLDEAISKVESGYADVSSVDAAAGDVRQGKKIVNSSGQEITGTLVPGTAPTGTVNITTNGTHDVAAYASANVNVPSDVPETQEKSVNPSTIQQTVTPDAGKLLSKVTVTPIQTETKQVTPTETEQTVTPTTGKYFTSVGVDAIPGDYVGGNVPRKSSSDLSASGATVNVPAGYYSVPSSKAVSNGTEGTPIATKGAVSNHSVSVTPAVTNAEGYINGGTHTGTPVTVSASELVSGSETKTENGTYDVTNLAQVVVNVSGEGGGTFPANPVPGDTPVVENASMGTITNASMTNSNVSITIPKSGIYRIKWSAVRSNTDGNWYSQLYVATAAGHTPQPIAGSKKQSSDFSQYVLNASYDMELTAGNVVYVYIQSRSTSYRISGGNISACIDWNNTSGGGSTNVQTASGTVTLVHSGTGPTIEAVGTVNCGFTPDFVFFGPKTYAYAQAPFGGACMEVGTFTAFFADDIDNGMYYCRIDEFTSTGFRYAINAQSSNWSWISVNGKQMPWTAIKYT